MRGRKLGALANCICAVMALEYQMFGTSKSTGTLGSVYGFVTKWR